MFARRLRDLKFDLAGSGVPRSKGVHLTEITRHITEKTNPRPPCDWDMDATREVGFLWEDILEYVLKDRLGARVGEVELDGIVGSPDGIGVDPSNLEVMVLEEYKATWRSSRKEPMEDVSWMLQVKGYLKMLGLRAVVMHVLYIMGNYRGSGPQRKSWRIQFTQEEIDETWALILKNKEEMKGAN